MVYDFSQIAQCVYVQKWMLTNFYQEPVGWANNLKFVIQRTFSFLICCKTSSRHSSKKIIFIRCEEAWKHARSSLCRQVTLISFLISTQCVKVNKTGLSFFKAQNLPCCSPIHFFDSFASLHTMCNSLFEATSH